LIRLDGRVASDYLARTIEPVWTGTRERIAPMSEKHPSWTRTRAGRNRVHWVAYDDGPGAEERGIVDQGYSASLAEADSAARAALAAAGMYQARRQPAGFRPPARVQEKARPREYLYSRRDAEQDEEPVVAAHLVVKKTATRVYVTRRSCGPDQIGTEDETWEPDERAIPLDRAGLKRDGSVASKTYRLSDFYVTREAALGGSSRRSHAALGILGIGPPCSVADIKAAYRLRALEVHPDRGGNPGDFQAVEAAYRQLLREAQAPES
jgi:hypothetical protein